MRDYLQRFTVLVCTRQTAANGGCSEAWQDGAAFFGQMTGKSAAAASPGGMPSAEQTAVLYHDGSVSLTFHGRVRREEDGTVWRVTGEETRIPAAASFAAAYVPVERLVTA